jgi:ubiquinone/menaquinone biosynthesis C-methylase UbiE
VDDADSVKASLEKRAEIEALNVADRQIDLAWLAEGTKITNKLNDFQNNINRIVSAGGTFQEKERWNDYYNIFQCAIKATQDAYMPNAQRKKEYLAIYADICKENETLIKYIVKLNSRSKTKELLEATSSRPNRNGTYARAAYNRWRDIGWKVQNGNSTSNGGSDPSAGTITIDE